MTDRFRDGSADPPANFDRLAGLYRWMEWTTFGPWLGLCRRAFLPAMKTARHALVLGDGDGRFTAALLRANRAVEVDAVDASPAMLRALERRAGRHRSRVRTCTADARRWTPESSGYDLVVTHFFLDCLTTDEVRALAARIRPALAANAMWVVSEFAIPEGAGGRLVARPLIALLYSAFGLLTGLRVRRLPDHPSALGLAGFALVERRIWLGGLLAAEMWRLGTPESASPCEPFRP